LQKNQQVLSNEIIGYVNSSESQYYGETYISQFNLGKVKVGQTVILKFSAFPFQEYGIVYGELKYVSDIVANDGYMAKISFPRGLVTTHNMKIQYREGLSAQGEIITKDLTLLQRFYYNIIRVIKVYD
jgi:HlyD family secretion protein